MSDPAKTHGSRSRAVAAGAAMCAAAFLPCGCDDGKAAPKAASRAPDKVTFNAHIRPILSDKCFSCHGFDKTTREADLRLDTVEGAYAALKGDGEKRAIVPGDAAKSEVWRRITTNDADDVMPPPDFHKPLSEGEVALIRRWIDQGAGYQEHWSFTALRKPEVPGAEGNAIDAFVLERLREEKIEPSPEADRATLLRRLSLDLTGLPPGPEETKAFLADGEAGAWERQVDRLLASPHYGERMAVPWLDAVRFADTVGYHGDQNVRIFPYRDYVIRSFNGNKRFDAFTIEQLAGDLLPGATDEQKIATGFLRLNLMTREGGAQPKEYLAKSMGDRVRAIGGAWLGLTTGCAECHDHKFDPMTAKDFYALGAFFADVRQWGVYADYGYTPNPDLKGVNNDWPFPPEIQARNEAVMERLEALRVEAARVLGDVPKGEGFGKWVNEAKAFVAEHPDGWRVAKPAEISTGAGTPAEGLEDGSVLLTGEARKGEVVTLKLPVGGVAVSAIRFEALPDERNGGKVGRAADGRFAVTPKFSGADGELKMVYAQADRRRPHGYKNGSHDPKLEAEWRSAPALWEEPGDAASRVQTAVYQLEKPFRGETLTVTLARRMLERGVRFVQLYHRGWDHHGGIEKKMPATALLTDQASAALVKDLKQRGLLEDTLVIWGGEFGRTPMGQGSGRDHHIRAFSLWMAGAGIRPGMTYGETDELGYNVVKDVVQVRDLHATLLQQFGIDHERFTTKFQGLDYKLTGVNPAQVVKGILG